MNRRDQGEDSVTDTTYTDLPSQAVTLAQRNVTAANTLNESLFATSRLQWRLGPGEQLSVQPFLVASQRAPRNPAASSPRTPAPRRHPTTPARTARGAEFRTARVTTLLARRLRWRDDLRAARGCAHLHPRPGVGAEISTMRPGHARCDRQSDNEIRDFSWDAQGKVARSWAETHKFTTGAEWAQGSRTEKPVTLLNGEPQLEEFGSEVDIRVRRSALYLQDEWDPNPNWATSLGVRWEAIETKSAVQANPVDNRSSVVNPLAHVVWRFDAPRRDQVRASLTQSYRPPTTQNLVARPRLNTRYPVPGPNEPTQPGPGGQCRPQARDSQRPGACLRALPLLEWRALGERVHAPPARRDPHGDFAGGGLMGGEPALGGAAAEPRPRDDPRHRAGREVRACASFTPRRRRSTCAPTSRLSARRVDGIPGPDNRLAGQPDMTGNLGADYRFPGTPLSLGGSVNWTPAYDVRVTAEQLETPSAARSSLTPTSPGTSVPPPSCA